MLVRLRSLGDSVLATPAFAMLRRELPEARIHVVMDERFAEALDGQPDVNGVLPLAAGIRGKAKLVSRIRALDPSLCVDMHGGSTAAWLTRLSGAPWRAGYGHFRHGWAYNTRIPRAQEVLQRPANSTVHTAEHHAAAMIHLGVHESEIPRARLDRPAPGDRHPFAVLHAGASHASKRWPVEGFLSVAERIRDRYAIEPVFMAGPGESSLVAQVRPLEICSVQSISALRNLLAHARIFVGNDSGPAHVAASFGVPCVVVFGSSDARIWHPWRVPHRVVRSPSEGSDRTVDGPSEVGGIRSIEPATVCSAVDDLLEEISQLSR